MIRLSAILHCVFPATEHLFDFSCVAARSSLSCCLFANVTERFPSGPGLLDFGGRLSALSLSDRLGLGLGLVMVGMRFSTVS